MRISQIELVSKLMFLVGEYGTEDDPVLADQEILNIITRTADEITDWFLKKDLPLKAVME